MKRNSFIKSLIGLVVAPVAVGKMVSGINWNTEHDYFIDKTKSCEGSHSTRMVLDENGRYKHESVSGYFYSHQSNEGEYIVYLKNGNKICFQLNKYEPEEWSRQYDYLSEMG